MLNVSRAQIESIRNAPELGAAVESSLAMPELARKHVNELSGQDWDCLQDACMDAIRNEAPVVESFDAEMSKGAFTVAIAGVPGAYFVSAPEFDDIGLFSTVAEARREADAHYGEFRLRTDPAVL